MAGAGEKLINSIQQIRGSAAQQRTHRVPNTRLEILSADVPTTLRCEEDRVLLGFSFPVNKCYARVCVLHVGPGEDILSPGVGDHRWL